MAFGASTAGRILAIALFTISIGAAAHLNGGVSSAAEASARPGFTLREVSAASGIRFTHHRAALDPKLDNIAPHIAGVGAGVAVGDFNNDGLPDLYFTNSRFGYPNALYMNEGNGTFVDVAAGAGVADVNREGQGVSMGAVWGDYDNDGREDLLVYKYGYLQLFHNLGNGKFEDVTAKAGLERWVNSNGAVWFDYDRDGLLDLYVTAYFPSDVDLWHVRSTRIMHNSFEFATNGGRNLLFHNLGGGRFEDVTDAMGVGSTRWTLTAAAADFNGDGWPDLFLANDYGPEELYLNHRGHGFHLADVGLTAASKSGMSASLGDAYDRGKLDVFVSNISERGYLFQRNDLRLNRMADGGQLENVASGPIADAGWAWGAQFGDLNNDGRNELFVANGFISADPHRTYWYDMSKVAGANRNVFQDAGNWPPIGTASLSGYERSRVFVHAGEIGWVDVARKVGIMDQYDGRAVALADLENRGALDVIVANQNQPALVYRALPEPGNHWIAFKLVATRSNRSAIGTEVVIEFGGEKQRRIVDGGMGFASQNDRRLHFGLGNRTNVDRVTVYWPSGTIQVVRGLAADQFHQITEPVP